MKSDAVGNTVYFLLEDGEQIRLMDDHRGVWIAILGDWELAHKIARSVNETVQGHDLLMKARNARKSVFGDSPIGEWKENNELSAELEEKAGEE